MRILGFDISSTTTGFSVIDCEANFKHPKLVVCSTFNPIKTGTIFERLDWLQNKTLEILDKYKPDIVAIEDVIQFMKGASTAKTISTLTLFNRTVGLTCFQKMGKNPKLLSVMKVRHTLKLSKELPKKEDIPELLEKRMKITFPYIVKKGGKIAPASYDAADSLAVALACSMIRQKEFLEGILG